MSQQETKGIVHYSQTPLPECGDCHHYHDGSGCGWLCSWWAYRQQHSPDTCPCGHSVERHRFDLATEPAQVTAPA